MPELPEVETIRRGLDRLARRKQIVRVDILCEKSFRGDPALIEGQTITTYERKGKALLMRLSNGLT